VSRARCWGDGDPLFERYHDEEWGFPVLDERGLFEKLSLEAFQSGMSWRTILAKRDAFRAAFARFEPDAVASFGDADVARLLADPGIVRNRAKIEATLANARAAVGLRATGEPLEALIRAHAPPPRERPPASWTDVRATVPESVALARELNPPWLSLRRADHALRADAGLRPGRRPPRRVPRAPGGGRRAPRRGLGRVNA